MDKFDSEAGRLRRCGRHLGARPGSSSAAPGCQLPGGRHNPSKGRAGAARQTMFKDIVFGACNDSMPSPDSPPRSPAQRGRT
jgi:hypothetical protein